MGGTLGIISGGLGIINALGGSNSSGGGNSSAGTASGSSDAAAQVAADMWGYYKANYQPLETNLINQANTAGSPDEFARARGAANADVTGAFNQANKQTASRMQGFGINPGSPAYQTTMASSDLAQGATKAGALTAADNNTRNLAYSKALDVVGLGRNIPAQSAASAANAANAANTASQTQFLQNQQNQKNIGYGLQKISGPAANWFGGNTSGSVDQFGNNSGNYAVGSGGNSGGTPYDPSIGYAKGGQVGLEPRPMDLRTGRPATEPPPGSNVVVERPQPYPQTGAADNPRYGRENEGIRPTARYAEGGNVIEAEKTGDGQYDATGLKSVLQSRGLNDVNAHTQAHAALARHKRRVVTPHMRHFAGGGGVGTQGLEGSDASDMGEIQGPGTGTSDSIPAQVDGQEPAALSSGEFVMNAEVPKLTGDEILEAINQAGLRKRGLEPQTSNDVPLNDGAQAYAGGGEIGDHGQNDPQDYIDSRRASQSDVRKSDRYRPSEMPVDERSRVGDEKFADWSSKTAERDRSSNARTNTGVRNASQRFIGHLKDAPHQYANGGRVTQYGLGA